MNSSSAPDYWQLGGGMLVPHRDLARQSSRARRAARLTASGRVPALVEIARRYGSVSRYQGPFDPVPLSNGLLRGPREWSNVRSQRPSSGRAFAGCERLASVAADPGRPATSSLSL